MYCVLYVTIFDYMKDNRIQAILPDALIERFNKESKKQCRSKSNLARKYIVDGLLKDEDKEIKK